MNLILLLFTYFSVYVHFSHAIDIKVIPKSSLDFNYERVSDCDIACEFTANPEKADAEFYIAMDDKVVKQAIESSKESDTSIKIIGSQEGHHYYNLLSYRFLKQHFQATSLLDRRSEIPWPLILNMDSLKEVEKTRDAKPYTTFVAKNCKPMNKRNEFVKAIHEVIGVFAPGKCFHNMEWPQCGDGACSKVEVIRDYKINLAFENGDSPGYVTEKIYHAMEAGVLPVYMGTADVADIIPKGSYIDVAEFNTPHDVANYLKLVLENETLYNSYFDWKHKPFDPEFEATNRVLWEVNHYCRVCRYVDAMQRGVKWDHLHQNAEDRIPEKFEMINNTFNLTLFWVVPTVLCLLFIIVRKVRKMLQGINFHVVSNKRY